jgi:D-alanyl-D-alanine carboxypeptidase
LATAVIRAEPPALTPTAVVLQRPTTQPTAAATSTPASAAATSAPAAPASQAAEEIAPELAAALQRSLDQIVSDGKIPGSVLAVHIPGYAVWTGASGFIDWQRSQPMTPSTPVRIASISKVFTAAVVLQLVEEGRLDLDAPVSAWFPDLLPAGDRTTVRNLLNHTSGLYDYLEDKGYLARAFERPEHRWAPEELVSYAAGQKLLFQPGQPGAWDYSSTNYVLLGMVVEAVTGNRLAHEMRERIFIPLGLNDTYFAPDEEVHGRAARGYRHEHDYTEISLSFAYATANLVSTVDDVQRFGEALFGGELLRPESLAAMQVFEDGKGQYNMPALEYGLGVMRNQLPVAADVPASAGTVLGHTGGFGGFRSALWHAPASGVTIALAMNQGATDPNILATYVFEAILEAQHP